MDRSTHNTNHEGDSRRAIAGQFLCFIGLMTVIAGALAILRTGERSVFFLVLIPLGLVLWFAGAYLRQPRTPAPRGEDRHG